MWLNLFLKRALGAIVFKDVGIRFSFTPVTVTNEKFYTATSFSVVDSSVAEFTLHATSKTGQKETLNLKVLADKTNIRFNVYGRLNFGTDLMIVDVERSNTTIKILVKSTTSDRLKVVAASTYVDTL